MARKEHVSGKAKPYISSYEPNVTSHVTIKYHYDYEKYPEFEYKSIHKMPKYVQIFIFNYESILITGSSNFHQLRMAYDFINGVIRDNNRALFMNNPFANLQGFINHHRRHANIKNENTRSFSLMSKIC